MKHIVRKATGSNAVECRGFETTVRAMPDLRCSQMCCWRLKSCTNLTLCRWVCSSWSFGRFEGS